MGKREIDGWTVCSGAFQSGDVPAIADVTTHKEGEPESSRFFRVVTDCSFSQLEDAKLASDVVVDRIESIDENGVPHPLTY
ncbi:hypothetical protein CAL29_15895 [Bordetella genomosp. 10]|uniref:Uncharacterized protein n=1 Tax=Bordetella genomosp. 10 TaxID=1416804 RepID=A0A261SEZ8_9BORD|nr:hypothetical protein [Bordetella genomosp. 10]OZI34933.1 hypothetical protein CAL29_15895 [Bordetella genomosp. 10]